MTYLEGESVDIGLVGSSLDDLGLLKGRPPLRERGQLDQVPDVGQGLSETEVEIGSIWLCGTRTERE